MNIHDLGKTGNVDRASDRAKKPGARADVLVPFVPRDEAQISASGRGTAAVIEELSERARKGGDREQIVARAMARLLSGELDDSQVHAATAQKLLDARFLGA